MRVSGAACRPAMALARSCGVLFALSAGVRLISMILRSSLYVHVRIVSISLGQSNRGKDDEVLWGN